MLLLLVKAILNAFNGPFAIDLASNRRALHGAAPVCQGPFMTLQELVNETLVEKHRRLMQAKCKHNDELWHSTYDGPGWSFTETTCLDCGKRWREDHGPVPESLRGPADGGR